MKIHLLLLPLIALSVMPGCDDEASLILPKQFIETKTYSENLYYVTRGISADECVISLQQQVNPKNGTLEFWTKSSLRELKSRGYTLVKSESVHNQQDIAGQFLQFTRKEMSYWLTIFVDQETILLVEAGGPSKRLSSYKNEYQTVLSSAKFPYSH
jgi:hypothetical protein